MEKKVLKGIIIGLVAVAAVVLILYFNLITMQMTIKDFLIQ